MRTTLDLSDHAYHLARAFARERNIGLGRAISEIISLYMNPDPPPSTELQLHDGFPVVRLGRPFSSQDVRQLLEDSE